MGMGIGLFYFMQACPPQFNVSCGGVPVVEVDAELPELPQAETADAMARTSRMGFIFFIILKGSLFKTVKVCFSKNNLFNILRVFLL